MLLFFEIYLHNSVFVGPLGPDPATVLLNN
jgi:hypothetical protein